LPLSLDSVVKLSLKKNQSVCPSRYQEILKSSLLFLLKEYALRQIAISPKTSKILSFKLTRFFSKTVRKYQINSPPPPTPLIQETLLYLENQGLLDQKNYVDYFLRRHSRKSTRRLKMLLLKQGIEPQFLPHSLISASEEMKKIKNILGKKNQRRLRFFKNL